jgi:hypothetical protein
MNKKRKRLERMAANPQGDWTIDDVKAVCQEPRAGLSPRWRQPLHGIAYLAGGDLDHSSPQTD